MSRSRLILLTSLFLVITGNLAFFKNVLSVYPMTWENSVFLASLAVLLMCLNTLILALLGIGRVLKPVLIVILLVSSLAAYFMDSYNVVLDASMIDNIRKTDVHEAMDLFSVRQALYFLLLGVLPSLFVYRVKLSRTSLQRSLVSRWVLIFGAASVSAVLILSLSNFYAPFIREHKPLRMYTNPGYYLYSSIKYANELFKHDSKTLKPLGVDALIPSSDKDRELVIFVLGETARSDHFSLNGYEQNTNPLLEQEDVISFDNVWSCGTSTAHSVPCIFSSYNRDHFSKSKAASTENLLDVLQRTGVNVIWLDNNSDSKHVADRVAYQNFKSPEVNPVCDIECRDMGMLDKLQDYIDTHPKGDIFIVLHQMGNHGPAYFKRYPAEFKRFTPTCDSNQLERCSEEEINNAYDNALLYTDYFLSQTIALLKRNNEEFESAMIYVSDHGESLGENNLYLHGLPYMIAPDTQKHVPLIMWLNDNIREEVAWDALKEKAHESFSHDNLFHTVLGILEIQTEVYDSALDMLPHKLESPKED